MFYDAGSGLWINLDRVQHIKVHHRKVTEDGRVGWRYQAKFIYADGGYETIEIDSPWLDLPTPVIPAQPGYFVIAMDDESDDFYLDPIIAWRPNGHGLQALTVDDDNEEADILCPGGVVHRPFLCRWDSTDAWKAEQLKDRLEKRGSAA